MIQLCFEKKDLLNIASCLSNAAIQIREHQLRLISESKFMQIDISLLDEYYAKRLELIERNRQNIEWLTKKMDEAKTEGGNIIATMTITDRQK